MSLEKNGLNDYENYIETHKGLTCKVFATGKKTLQSKSNSSECLNSKLPNPDGSPGDPPGAGLSPSKEATSIDLILVFTMRNFFKAEKP